MRPNVSHTFDCKQAAYSIEEYLYRVLASSSTLQTKEIEHVVRGAVTRLLGQQRGAIMDHVNIELLHNKATGTLNIKLVPRTIHGARIIKEWDDLLNMQEIMKP